MKTEQEQIKSLLFKSEVAYSKVQNDFEGRCINPSQLAAATKFHKKACALARAFGWNDQDLIDLHHQVINEKK